MKKLCFAVIFIFLMCAGAASTPVRLIGMNSLDLIFEDESNRINLYDFGGNIAGLYGDERGSSAEGFLSYGRVSYSDTSGTLEPEVTRWGGFLPTDAGVSVNTFTALGGLPTGGIFIYRSPNGYAAAAKVMYSSTSTHYESSNRSDDATAPLFGVSFSKHFSIYDAGAMGEYSSIKITNNQDDTEIHASMKTVNGGFAAQVSPMITVGISAGLGFPAADLSESNTNYDFGGNAFSGGIQCVANAPGFAKIGAKLDFLNANLGGEATTGNVTLDLGDLHFTDIGFDMRVLFASILFPLRAGALLSYESFHPEFEGQGTPLFDIDMRITTMNFGFGFGYALPFITPGFQYNHSNQNASDNLNDAENDASQWDVRFGGESKLSYITIRGGFSMGKQDPNIDTDDDEMKNRSLSFGGTFSVPLQPYKFEFAYVNTETKLEENPEDSRETDNALYLAFKMKF